MLKENVKRVLGGNYLIRSTLSIPVPLVLFETKFRQGVCLSN